MNKQLFEIDHKIRRELDGVKEIQCIQVDEVTSKILNYYKNLIEKQREELNEVNKQSSKELDAFIIGDAVSDGICVVNKDGIVTAINRGYTEITEIEEEEVVGKHIQTLQDKGYFTNAVSLLVLKQKKKITSLSTIIGNNKKVLIIGNPFFDDNGEVVRVLTVMRDLTELIKLKERLEKIERKNEKYLYELNYFRSKLIESSNIIGESVKMKEVRELISYVAKTEATVLVTGETGCGKEVISKEIHDKSNRKDGPYIKVNCAAIPDTLIESELFGYEKGSFTGAQNKTKPGMFEMANGGTILLDEIGEMPLSLQSKLLRVLQEKEIMRIGGTNSIKLDVRVIAATNQDLKALIEKGKFREDLYYRLNVVPVKLPPLRERKGDIPILAHTFLQRHNTKYNKQKCFDSMGVHALESYEWPGNVRELQNVVERLVVIDDNEWISCDDITKIIGKGKATTDNQGTLTLKEAVDRFEREIIEDALRKYGSTYKAAKILGVTQPTVFRKAKALGILLNNA